MFSPGSVRSKWPTGSSGGSGDDEFKLKYKTPKSRRPGSGKVSPYYHETSATPGEKNVNNIGPVVTPGEEKPGAVPAGGGPIILIPPKASAEAAKPREPKKQWVFILIHKIKKTYEIYIFRPNKNYMSEC